MMLHRHENEVGKKKYIYFITKICSENISIETDKSFMFY